MVEFEVGDRVYFPFNEALSTAESIKRYSGFIISIDIGHRIGALLIKFDNYGFLRYKPEHIKLVHPTTPEWEV